MTDPRIAGGVAIVAAAALLGLASGQGRGAIAQPKPAPSQSNCVAPTLGAPGWRNGDRPQNDPLVLHQFKLSACYPVIAPPDRRPWLAFDPRTEPQKYMRAVLDYFYEGNVRANVEDSFDPERNPVRGWYNAPWLDYTTNGREGTHGLTRERSSCPGEIDPEQNQVWVNYAVGYYNAPGGVTIGRVWAGQGRPHPDLASMPEGTVAAKLLFTTASEFQAPFLAGAPTWNAYVYDDMNDDGFFAKPGSKRHVHPVRLLQVDFAVRDSRVDATTGWVFGTFVYGGGAGSGPSTRSGWTNVEPVGLMWGNANLLDQQWINPNLRTHLGWYGRLNGPIDNPRSSCLSCHATAETPDLDPLVPVPGRDPEYWFRNVPAGTPFRPGVQSLDYSLQFAVGVHNFRQVVDRWPDLGPPPRFCG